MNLLFDLWGTVIENGVFPSPVRQIKRILRLNMPFPEYITRFEKVFMLNEFKNLTEAFEEVCKEFKITPPPFIIDKCVGLWNKNAILAKPYPETFETLQALKKDHNLFLISNTDLFSADQVIKKFELNKHFPEIILSYEFGMLKTSPDFFKTMEDKYGLKKSETIMIGDSLESDMRPAEESGIRSILVDRRQKREYKEKIKSLDEINTLL